MIERIRAVASLLRDVGIIIGVPILAYVGSQLYGLQQQSTQAQIALLKEQVETLKERQYDRASTVFKSLKEASEAELDAIEKSISLVGGQKINIRDFNSTLLCLNLKKDG